MTADRRLPHADTHGQSEEPSAGTGTADADRWSRVPEELTSISHWMVWKWGPRDDDPTKLTKPLYNPRTNWKASSTDPKTWGTFAVAVAALEHGGYDGIGFGFTAELGLVGVDLDHVRDPVSGDTEPWAAELIDAFPGYVEVSPSGTGYHLIGRAVWHATRHRVPQIEVYAEGRYFTVTGDVVAGHDRIGDAQDFFDDLHRSRFADPEPEPPPDGPPVTLSDHEVLDVAFNAKNADKVRALYGGSTAGYPSHSEADAALIGCLCFYTQDPDQLDRLFQSSGLMRPKWLERRGSTTYGRRTIDQILAKGGPTYSPGWQPEGGESRTGVGVDGEPEPEPTDIDWLREKLAVAEAENKRLVGTIVRLQTERDAALKTLNDVKQALRNPRLRPPERIVAIALAFELQAATDRDPHAEDYRVWTARLGEASGLKPKPAGKHVESLEQFGLVWRRHEYERVPETDLASGKTVLRPRRSLHVRSVASPMAMLESLASVDPEASGVERKRQGGRREKLVCPDCGPGAVVTETSHNCSQCGQFLTPEHAD